MIRKYMNNILFRRGVVFLMTAACCAFFIWLILFSTDGSALVEEKSPEKIIRPVTVLLATPGTYQTSIEAYGEVTPEWKVAVKSKVQGEIVKLSEKFRKGNTVKKGEMLLAVEQTDYRVQLTQALLGLKEAKTKLLVEEKEGQDALEAWKRSGIENLPSSPLLLRKPYLDTARANVSAAEEKVNQAQLIMNYTKIKAPFDGLVVQRQVSPGGTVFAGDEVGTLYGVNTFIVALHIGKKQWAKLSPKWKGSEVRIFDEAGQCEWTGKLVREGKLFEAGSRLRTLFVEVDEPLLQSPPLLPGNFVRVVIPGRSVSRLLCVPDSARTQKGLVWYVDSNDQLQSVEAKPVFREQGQLYFDYTGDEAVKIVVNPNSSFVNGLKVTPVVEGN